MRLSVNGEIREIPDGGTVKELLEEIGVRDQKGVAVAVDGEVVRKSEWPTTRLEPGNRVEVLRAVQGG